MLEPEKCCSEECVHVKICAIPLCCMCTPHTEADKLATKAKAKPVPTSAPPSTYSQKSIPIHVREWYDVEPQKWKSKDAQSFAVSKKLIALLRHGTLPRDQDGAVEFRRLKQKIRSGFPYSAHWSIHLWLDHLRTGG